MQSLDVPTHTRAIYMVYFLIATNYNVVAVLRSHQVATTSASILDQINTQLVHKILANKHANPSERRVLQTNDLDAPKSDDAKMRVNVNVLLRNDSVALINDLIGYHGSSLLKSSRNALKVTQKDYLKKDWCKTEPLVQRIREPGCETRNIINRFCYGQCNSFFIPKNPPRRAKRRFRKFGENEDDDFNGAAFKACAFCKPKKFTWITITLRCPGMFPEFRRKRVQRIKQCRCMNE